MERRHYRWPLSAFEFALAVWHTWLSCTTVNAKHKQHPNWVKRLSHAASANRKLVHLLVKRFAWESFQPESDKIIPVWSYERSAFDASKCFRFQIKWKNHPKKTNDSSNEGELKDKKKKRLTALFMFRNCMFQFICRSVGPKYHRNEEKRRKKKQSVRQLCACLSIAHRAHTHTHTIAPSVRSGVAFVIVYVMIVWLLEEMERMKEWQSEQTAEATAAERKAKIYKLHFSLNGHHVLMIIILICVWITIWIIQNSELWTDKCHSAFYKCQLFAVQSSDWLAGLAWLTDWLFIGFRPLCAFAGFCSSILTEAHSKFKR